MPIMETNNTTAQTTSVLGCEPLLALGEVARQLSTDPSTVWRWISRGVSGEKLVVASIGGRVKVRPSDVREFLNRVAQAKAKARADRRLSPLPAAQLQATSR